MSNTNRKRNKKGRITAWLITWDDTGNHAKQENNIAAILNPRYSSKRIKEIVEIIYANKYYTLTEQAQFAKNNSVNPYKAEYEVRYQGRIICGHNPFLVARIVDNLHVTEDANGEEKAVWEEREKPKIWTHKNR